jgi:glycosyltransferase involved in cell wall biosynthesis
LVAGGAVPGEERYGKQLLDAGKQKLGDRLICLGHLEELRGFYNTLDLFVSTSKEEACSIGILEALACGCPVVGYPSKSVDEQVLPEGGEIVPQDDIEELTAALGRWLRNKSQLASGREGARRQVENHFDTRKLSDQLWNEYEALLNGSRN